MRGSGFILGVVFLAILAPGQPRKAEKLYTKAEQAVQERAYEQASLYLLEALAADSAYAPAYERLFFLYRRFRKSDELYALRYAYLRHLPEEKIRPAVRTELALAELSQGNYNRAEELVKANEGKEGLTNQHALLKQSIDFARGQFERNTEALDFEWLPEAVNHFQFQYLPVLTVDGRTLFYTARASQRSDENLVVSEYLDGQWRTSRSVSSVVNSRYNEGACTVSANGRTLIFTACDGRQSYGNCDLYMTQRLGDDWTRPVNLGNRVNSRYWDSQPSLSADGKMLYFVSERPGGEGGKDIWVSRFEQEAWTPAENLGPVINGPGEEATPFIHADNQTLFFSSDGYISMGGFDLFRSVKKNGQFSRPVNLGYPLNTHKDEVSLFITADGRRAYYAQETVRLGEYLDSRLATFSLDSSLVAAPVRYVTGVVSDEDSGEPLAANIALVDLENRANLYDTESDPVTGRYFVVLREGESFAAFVSGKGYLFRDVVFETDGLADTLNIDLSPIKSGKQIVLENVYFESASYSLDQKSGEELDRVYQLLTDYPHIKVQIAGHTDNTGGDAINKELSLQRARMVFNYLLQKGIPAVRMRAVGFADQKPRATNDTPEGRQLNRRIEFRITEAGS